MTYDEIRRSLLPGMHDRLMAALEAGEPVWNTEGLRRDFEVLGFAAPLVVVRRRGDGKRGSLMFTHSPRFYFGWEEE